MVSIIVPVYNIRQYLPHCIQSLLVQTYKDIEILLVDDGSTDGSGKLCDSLAASDRRIFAIHKENGGLSDARNAGLDRARGQWILFVDGDDYLVPDAVELLMKEAEEDVDFVQFLYQETPDTDWLPPLGQAAKAKICTDNAVMWRRLYDMGGVAASSCTKLWNSRIFQQTRFQKDTLHEDEELLNRVLPACKKVVYTQLVLYGYVFRQGSIVHSTFKPKQMDVFPIMERRIQLLKELDHKDLVLTTQSRLFLTSLLMFGRAKKAKAASEAKELKKRLMILTKIPGLELSGQYKLVYKLTRFFPGTPELYFFARGLLGKDQA